MWANIYRAYDDDTLINFSNAGLLRRAAKEVEAGSFEWLSQSAEGGVIKTEGQQVSLDGRGVQQARCDCPAPGVCKHILAAVLWLRSQKTDAEAQPETSATEVKPITALEEILALHWPPIFKLAGVAAVRQAANMPDDAANITEMGEHNAVLVIEQPALGQSCRYLAGLGFAGMVSDLAPALRKAAHLIALAAVWRAHNQTVPWPDGVRIVAPVTDVVGESEKQFIAQVQSCLNELLRGGLAHVTPAVSGRLQALNMSARGEGLPRLAALLRNLSGMAQALERRDHRVAERDALAMMGRINALCEAMPRASGTALAALRGKLRREYATDATMLTLLPLGAYWWQTLGGARGLTLCLWDTTKNQLLQTTLARPDASDPGFHREAAWNTLALWPGVGSAAAVCAAGLQIEQARLSEDGLNMALGGLSRATKLPAWQADDPRLDGIGCASWDDVNAKLRAATGLAGEPLRALLLRPSATQSPTLDEAQQRLNWLLQDDEGNWLQVEIPCGPEYEKRVANLDRLTARKAPIYGVLAVVERSGAQTILNPAAVIIGAGQDTLKVVSLDYAAEPAHVATLTDRILRMLKSRQAAAPVVAPLTLIARLLSTVNEVLETQAATGRLKLTEHQHANLLSALAPINSVGLHTIATAIQAHLNAPSAFSLLRLSYLCELMAELEGLT